MFFVINLTLTCRDLHKRQHFGLGRCKKTRRNAMNHVLTSSVIVFALFTTVQTSAQSTIRLQAPAKPPCVVADHAAPARSAATTWSQGTAATRSLLWSVTRLQPCSAFIIGLFFSAVQLVVHPGMSCWMRQRAVLFLATVRPARASRRSAAAQHAHRPRWLRPPRSGWPPVRSISSCTLSAPKLRSRFDRLPPF